MLPLGEDVYVFSLLDEDVVEGGQIKADTDQAPLGIGDCRMDATKPRLPEEEMAGRCRVRPIPRDDRRQQLSVARHFDEQLPAFPAERPRHALNLHKVPMMPWLEQLGTSERDGDREFPCTQLTDPSRAGRRDHRHGSKISGRRPPVQLDKLAGTHLTGCSAFQEDRESALRVLEESLVVPRVVVSKHAA
jgi:hypothetical protein